MPRAGLTPAIVVAEAARLADEVGLDRLTLALVAQRLGVALPSLYKHIKGLDALHQQVAALTAAELADAVATAAVGLSGTEAMLAVATAYRAYARAHPGRYPSAERVPDPGDPAHVRAAERAVGTVAAVLSGYGLTGDDAIDATRALRNVVHGFVSLENGGGFGLPQDVDRSFTRLIMALDDAFRTWPDA